MRYYVIINGINSLTIPGLAIKDLPPISKTLMRNQKETIDGRDGDIITELGYSAYDKALTIGLYGSYDINDIIAFFNQKGTIVFSDEPDKYYNFTILDQIDYDKLVKFRTATIRIHCQPFKYPLTETPEEMELKFVTGTGTDLTLNNTAEAKISLNLQGNTSQETTTGKNLCEPEAYPVSVSGTYIVASSSTPVTSPYTTPNAYRGVGFLARVEAGVTYTISNDITGFNYSNIIGIYALKSDITNSAKQLEKITGATFTPNYSGYALIGGSARASGTTISWSWTQLEKGSTATDYEPYTGEIPAPSPSYEMPVQVVTGDNTITISNSDNTQSQEYEINLGTLELCKIDTYQDYLYKSGENWYKHTEIGKVVLDGSNKDKWSTQDKELTNSWRYYTSSVIPNAVPNVGLSNKFISVNSSAINTVDSEAFCRINQDQVAVRLNKTRATTLNEFKDWVEANPFNVYYVLATPTEEQITNAELIEQLEARLNAVSYEDQTNISQENDNMPFIIWAIALRKGSNEAVINNIGNTVSKPTISITGSGILEIYLNGTQMLSVDMSSDTNIVIDTQNLEAYNPTTMQLKNRKVTGDYSKFVLPPGNSTIKVTGYFTNVTITNYTRWL